MATNKLAMIYISSPVHMSPWREIGMKIFRVIGWLTNNAALMSPIHSMAEPTKRFSTSNQWMLNTY